MLSPIYRPLSEKDSDLDKQLSLPSIPQYNIRQKSKKIKSQKHWQNQNVAHASVGNYKRQTKKIQSKSRKRNIQKQKSDIFDEIHQLLLGSNLRTLKRQKRRACTTQNSESHPQSSKRDSIQEFFSSKIKSKTQSLANGSFNRQDPSFLRRQNEYDTRSFLPSISNARKGLVNSRLVNQRKMKSQSNQVFKTGTIKCSQQIISNPELQFQARLIDNSKDIKVNDCQYTRQEHISNLRKRKTFKKYKALADILKDKNGFIESYFDKAV